MEQIPECPVTNITINALPNDQPKRKSGSMRFLRVALFKMRGRSSAAKPSVVPVDDDDGSKRTWEKFVGSMRPLHLQSNVSPRSYSEPATTLQSPKPDSCGGYVSDFVAEEEPYSPSPPSSRYASAVGLNELVGSDEDSEKQDVIVEEEHVDGDEMIDAKADKFIAQFYEQMRLQRMDSVDLRYEERSHRSLGS